MIATMKTPNDPDTSSSICQVTGYVVVPKIAPAVVLDVTKKSTPASAITPKYTFFTVSRKYIQVMRGRIRQGRGEDGATVGSAACATGASSSTTARRLRP